jgi:hypothetical protein
MPSVRAFDRDPDMESTADTRLGIHFYGSAVLLNDLFGDEEADASSMRSLRRVKKSKDMVARLIVHPDTVVLDMEDHVIVAGLRTERDLVGRFGRVALAGLDRILGDVHQRHRELVTIDIDGSPL